MNKVFIPTAIVVSGLIIAGAVYLTNKQQQANNAPADENIELAIAPIDSNDHILGDPNAEIVIVEYSDYECPYCKGFHGTMKRIMEEYGSTGKVAWVLRNFPLPGHKSAMPSAIAAECVAKLGGNDKFWEYSEILFAGSPESLSTENLLAEALEIGINEGEYKTCLTSDYPKDEIAKDVKDGTEISKVDPKFGTPYNILISKGGAQMPIRGNQPYATVKAAIDTVLSGSEAN